MAHSHLSKEWSGNSSVLQDLFSDFSWELKRRGWMRTKKGQHREKLLLLLDLHRNSGLSRDDGEAPGAQTSGSAAEERKTDTPWSTNAAAPSRESNPTQRGEGKQSCRSAVHPLGAWHREGVWLCLQSLLWLTLNPAPAGNAGIQNKTPKLQVHQGKKAVFTKLPAGSGCLVQINGNWVP